MPASLATAPANRSIGVAAKPFVFDDVHTTPPPSDHWTQIPHTHLIGRVLEKLPRIRVWRAAIDPWAEPRSDLLRLFIGFNGLGSVGRAAVSTARSSGRRIVAGVRRKRLSAAAALETWSVVVIDDDEEPLQSPRICG
jgi:hypothetical protein